MKLIVLDFDSEKAYVYTVKLKVTKKSVEELLKKLGHISDNCQWMLTKHNIIIK